MAYADVDNSPTSIKPLDGALPWSANPANTMSPRLNEVTEEERLLMRRNFALACRLGITGGAKTREEAMEMGLLMFNQRRGAMSNGKGGGHGKPEEADHDPGGTGDIFQAAREGNRRRLLYLLDVEKVPAGRTRWSGVSPLHRACEEGQLDIVKLLLGRKGVDISGKTSWGWSTPMHLACGRGHQAVANLLLDKGARWDVVDKAGRTPLELAIIGGFAVAARQLDAKFTANDTTRREASALRKQQEEKETRELKERLREEARKEKKAKMEASVLAKYKADGGPMI